MFVVCFALDTTKISWRISRSSGELCLLNMGKFLAPAGFFLGVFSLFSHQISTENGGLNLNFKQNQAGTTQYSHGTPKFLIFWGENTKFSSLGWGIHGNPGAVVGVLSPPAPKQTRGGSGKASPKDREMWNWRWEFQGNARPHICTAIGQEIGFFSAGNVFFGFFSWWK